MYKKSLQNMETAIYAEKNKYFEVATSRYYYTIFTIITNYLFDADIKIKSNATNTHANTIDTFLQSIKNKIPIEDISILSQLHKLRGCRNKYEYKENYISEKNIKKNLKIFI